MHGMRYGIILHGAQSIGKGYLGRMGYEVREAAKETLITFTQIYRLLSPYDKKRLMYQLIHSIIYTKDNISIRYYIIPQIDTIINEKGVTMAPAAGAGFATPTSWRP